MGKSEVEFKKDLDGKVHVLVNHNNDSGDGLVDFELVGFEVLPAKSEVPVFSRNNETAYNLVGENGEFSELVVGETFGGIQSRVPCYEARVFSPNCNGSFSKKTYISLSSKSIDLAFTCY
jgi:hypothetical protein